MNDKLIIAIVLASTLGIISIAVWQQQRRLPELNAKRPPTPSELVTPPPGLLGNDGKTQGGPLDFASLFKNLKPAKQQCFLEKFGQARLDQILANPGFVPTGDDNNIIGQCLLAGAAFQESPISPGPDAAQP